MLNIKELHTYIKKTKVRLLWLSDKTGYSRHHISNVLNENMNTSKSFLRVMNYAIDEHKKTPQQWNWEATN